MSKENEQNSPQFLSLWQNSENFAKLESHAVNRGLVAAARDASTDPSNRSTLWQNLSSMSSADQAHLMSRLSSTWPFRDERRALTWPVHAGLVANCVTSSLIATRINSEMFLYDAKAKFFESIRKCPKSPFVFGVYSSGVTYFMLHQVLVTPKVYNELTPCPSCLVINSIAIGLLTGIALPMLATPYLAHYVLINREANTGGSSRAMPVVNNLLEFLTLGWEGSKPARPVIAMCAAIQMIVSFGSMYAMLWGRERMFNTLELDSDLARRLVAEAQTSSSLKQKILDFLRKIPLVNGAIPEAPENERVA
ncbi:uncharacterized protein CELE_F55A12.2 [Caenorhabditis elegans]|uniref:Transmembrane protein n=3 Tax=Caenorhabditis elegans TaxID=6239 RepID=H2KYZ8_CAEEL|nr:Transmembrane protein [Caenorhabditis elegans]CCD65435.1 Transmembrane protein [Caenorhabditis elegans]|eukprot:NP_001021494.1 Uncharacterized protein CELE_F55A12.2 [Caenorhabditis elegans]